MTKNNEQIIECKYKFQSIEKFAGKPYCTLHNETCEFINFVCDKNCQVYEDYKQLKRKEQECEKLQEIIQLQNKIQMEVCEEKNEELDQLKKENEDLKDVNAELDVDLQNARDSYVALDLMRVGEYNALVDDYNKLKQTLAEIKKIAQYDVYTPRTDLCLKLNWIKKKINEVENDKSRD